MPDEADRNKKIMELARKYESEGDLEFDAAAVISEGDDNGAYVQAWKWVPFDGTELCKDPDTCDHRCRVHG